ncbi:sodium-dependent phosphate transport protein 2B-like [Antedon mediterranea]|uniref:sodium-dependent phosphate transport protein 2B-like n=1 Tax=Antedon mediterranea TaxID=105859 RepID=UPI003AF54219
MEDRHSNDIELDNVGYVPNEDELVNSEKKESNVHTKQNVNKDKDEEADPWLAVLPEIDDNQEPWKYLDCMGRMKRVASYLWLYVCLPILFIGFLYLFICSLDFLSSAFRLLGGEAAGEVISESDILSNPVSGVMIGVLVTVLVQSSSTSTSIVVSMVGAGILEVKIAIPIIMGANIGTSVTNTIVALGQSGDRNEFRRAFGGATVHDMFNWLTVAILLPIEWAFGYLYKLSEAILPEKLDSKEIEIELLKVLTKPFTKLIIEVDKKAITAVATKGEDEVIDVRVLKVCDDGPYNVTPCEYEHLFANTSLTDSQAGVIMLFVSLFLLCFCLFVIIKILHTVLRGKIAHFIKKFINADFPGKLSFLAGYLAILVGAGLTFLVQSSSIFTSAITPLVGVGVITLDRMYPLTLGANIGTTATAMIASLAASGSKLKPSIQVALCHLIFNITGIIIWYPIPFMRQVPISLAKSLGNTTAKYRWFALLYLILVFFLLPGIVFSLSLWSIWALVGFGLPILILFLLIVLVNILQNKRPGWLPVILRDWEFLPQWLHSLKPLDRIITKLLEIVCICCYKRDVEERVGGENSLKSSFVSV